MPWAHVTNVSPSSLPANLDLAWRQSPFQGLSVCGDDLLVETGRLDGAVQFLLIDVTGHGEPAAETVSFVVGQLGTGSFEGLGPADLLTRLHARLQGHWLDTDRFVEAQAVRVEGPTGAVTASRAGGLLALWCWTLSGSWVARSVPGATFLGIPHLQPYTEGTDSFAVGEGLLTFSDGVPEAGKETGIQFQDGSLTVFLNGLARPLPPTDLLVRLWQALQQHAPTTWNDDDVTAFVLVRT